MSIATWMKEFYPRPAGAVPTEYAAAHSLQKWKGGLPTNLARHEVQHTPIEFDNTTCALCRRSEYDCKDCVLYEVRDNTKCDVRMAEERRSPWHMHIGQDNGESMIFWLEKAAALEKERRGPKPKPKMKLHPDCKDGCAAAFHACPPCRVTCIQYDGSEEVTDPVQVTLPWPGLPEEENKDAA